LRSCWRARSQRPWCAAAPTKREPGPMFCAMGLGIADNGQRTSGEQASGSSCASTAITEPSHRQPVSC
jgi:hypothetical protein